MTSWNTIKEFYSNKPVHYNTGEERKQFPLPQPYTEQQIFDFETKHNIKLPEELRSYLTCVSREFRTSSYPHTVKLEYYSEKCMIPLNETIFDDKGDEYDFTSGMIQIGDGGCSFSDWIVVNGNHYSSVWHCNGDCMYKDKKSLLEYLLPEFKMNTDFDLIVTAKSYEILRIMAGIPSLNYTI